MDRPRLALLRRIGQLDGGNLEMNGNPSFEGLILVLGGGSINRKGGGNATIQYDSVAVAKALNMSGPIVMGVREY